MLSNPPTSLGNEIRYQRRLAGLTLKQVAARVGVTGAQLHRYEMGITNVTTGRLVAVANALGIRPDVLLNAATKPDQASAFANHVAGPANDVATLLEMFMAIKEPSHRDALMAVARMMSSSSPQPTETSGSASQNPAEVFAALAA
jgi:transcriptional regulator with XRE-family HTH domain